MLTITHNTKTNCKLMYYKLLMFVKNKVLGSLLKTYDNLFRNYINFDNS